MNFKEELQDLSSKWKPAEERAVFVPDTEEELFLKVKEACLMRAKYGCTTLFFEWERHYSDNKEEWDRYFEIREKVVSRMQSEGLNIEGRPKTFDANRVWNEWTEQWEPNEVKHFISVMW